MGFPKKLGIVQSQVAANWDWERGWGWNGTQTSLEFRNSLIFPSFTFSDKARPGFVNPEFKPAMKSQN